MLLSTTELTKGTDTDGNSTSSLGSLVYPEKCTFLLVVKSRTGITAVPNIPTFSGNSISWQEIDHVDPDNAGSSRVRATLFRGHTNAAVTETLALDFAGQNQTHVSWAINVIHDIDYKINDGIVQSAKNVIDSAGPAATSLAATLAAFQSPKNATFGVCVSNNSTVVYTEGSGFSEVTLQQEASGVINTEFKNTNDTSVDFTFDSHLSVAVIAVELRSKRVKDIIGGNIVAPYR